MRRCTVFAVMLVFGTWMPQAKADGPAATPGVGVPGSFALGYGTPQLATQVGGTLEFVNADIQPHDITSVATIAPGVPLFRSETIGAGVTEVMHLDRVVAGQAYEFFCTVHPQTMRGTLTVLPV